MNGTYNYNDAKHATDANDGMQINKKATEINCKKATLLKVCWLNTVDSRKAEKAAVKSEGKKRNRSTTIECESGKTTTIAKARTVQKSSKETFQCCYHRCCRQTMLSDWIWHYSAIQQSDTDKIYGTIFENVMKTWCCKAPTNSYFLQGFATAERIYWARLLSAVHSLTHSLRRYHPFKGITRETNAWHSSIYTFKNMFLKMLLGKAQLQLQ